MDISVLIRIMFFPVIISIQASSKNTVLKKLMRKKLSSYNEQHLFEYNHGPSRAKYHQRLSTEQRKKYSIRRCRHQHLIHAEHVLSLDSFPISNTTQTCIQKKPFKTRPTKNAPEGECWRQANTKDKHRRDHALPAESIADVAPVLAVPVLGLADHVTEQAVTGLERVRPAVLKALPRACQLLGHVPVLAQGTPLWLLVVLVFLFHFLMHPVAHCLQQFGVELARGQDKAEAVVGVVGDAVDQLVAGLGPVDGGFEIVVVHEVAHAAADFQVGELAFRAEEHEDVSDFHFETVQVVFCNILNE